MEAILFVALDNRGREKGTILDAIPVNAYYGPKDIGFFLPVRVKSTKYSLFDLKKMRVGKVLNISAFMSELSLSARVAQRDNIVATRPIGLRHEDILIKPQFDKVIDLDAPGMILDATRTNQLARLAEVAEVPSWL